MKTPTLGHSLSIGTAVAILAGCGGSQPPIGGPGATLQSRAIATHAQRSRSWMRPEAKSDDLTYISNPYANYGDVVILNYPQTSRALGTLNISAQGLCRGTHGTVWTMSGNSLIQYPHGGTKPIKALDLSQEPIGCAVDPQSGDLAVAEDGTTVSIYSHHETQVSTYKTPARAVYCTYDNEGDLFVDAFASDGSTIIAELSRGGNRFAEITLNHNVIASMGIQWYGRYLAIGYAPGIYYGARHIYHYKIEGANGYRVGGTEWKGSANYFAIGRSNMIVLQYYDAWIGAYPSGKPLHQVMYNLFKANGVVVSFAPNGR